LRNGRRQTARLSDKLLLRKAEICRGLRSRAETHRPAPVLAQTVNRLFLELAFSITVRAPLNWRSIVHLRSGASSESTWTDELSRHAGRHHSWRMAVSVPWKSATPAATLDSAQEVLDLCVEGERLFLAAVRDGRSRACRRRSASAVRGCRTWREGRAAVWRRPLRSARTMRRRRPSAGSAASISSRCASAVFGDEILIGLAYARRAPETAANVVVGDHRVTTRLGELQTKKTAVPWERPRCLGLGLELS
jgi:hypothetical protein